MSIESLRSELLTGHPVTGMYSSDNVVAASQINSPNRIQLRSVTMTQLREWASLRARAFKISAGIDDVTLTDQHRNLCLVADKLLGTDSGTLDPGNLQHVAFVDELVVSGVLSSSDKRALVDKATQNISRAQELNLGFVKVGHIQNARSQ